MAIAGAAGLALTGLSAAAASAPPIQARTVIEYRFQDSSVPPEYHRSFTLTVTGDGVAPADAHLVVDSYGTVVHDVSERVSDADWSAVNAAVLEGDFPTSAGPDGGCEGGTVTSLRAERAGVVLAEAVAASCGDDGGAAQALEAAIAPVLDDFDLDALLASGDVPVSTGDTVQDAAEGTVSAIGHEFHDVGSASCGTADPAIASIIDPLLASFDMATLLASGPVLSVPRTTVD